ncbi:hypothetical protein EK21DRAFT_116149 [Setomelanomma holmii]|uniref:UBC core domain-containing protein n=1 Tax=Setomelanomma holmii TaxID=210430 RepID=A0A9P4LIY6_9PLEO|nr:hypothetical protein EK21DRAFT_116149 [Setomelanomma holmii]
MSYPNLFQTNEKSPLTNLVLPSRDLSPDVKKKEGIAAFLSGSNITSKYKSLRGDTHLMRVSIKSPLNTWSLSLPKNLKLAELWELAFRLTKGRYTSFELQHRNACLPSSQQVINAAINPDHTIFITPVDAKTKSTPTSGNEELCLVKVYDRSFYHIVVSFWEPKNTTRSVSSAVFHYYRARFLLIPATPVESPFVLWTKLRDVGDGQLNGSTIDGAWEPLSGYFTSENATGVLTEESCVDKSDNTGDCGLAASRRNINGSQPLVFKVALAGPPSSEKKRRNNLSRLDVLKHMFDAFINRLLPYSFQTHIGLITFGTKASVAQAITNAVENFRHKLNNMQAIGDTATWDSIALAQDQLQAYAENYPNAKLRIACISDGEDNKSQQSVNFVASRLLRQNITLDSFCLGDARNEDLQTMSYLTGGYTFEPKTLEEAMAICELEPVLSFLERLESAESDNGLEQGKDHYFRNTFRATPSLFHFYAAGDEVVVDHVNGDVCPERKRHPQLADDFVELGAFARHSTHNRTDGNLRLNRIQSEIRNSGANRHPNYDIYICEQNMGLWKIVMQGPPKSTYSGDTFLLYIEMGANYPMFAPTARFSTPICHPNNNRHGRICHSILDRNWTVHTSNKDLIDSIYLLLLVPEFSDPINTVVTLNYRWDEVQFKEEAQKHIQKHASKLRAAWREEILG